MTDTELNYKIALAHVAAEFHNNDADLGPRKKAVEQILWIVYNRLEDVSASEIDMTEDEAKRVFDAISPHKTHKTWEDV